MSRTLSSNHACAWSVLPFLLVLLFWIAKYPSLCLPFFWDELGVYGTIVFHLASTGPSMMPGAVDQWLSHGHPLLYPFVISLICKWFGANVFVAHTANLLIASGLLLSMFLHVSKISDKWTEIASMALLCVQPVFFAQSVLVLPEVALATALWLTTWYCAKQKMAGMVLAGSAAVLIKEPAIIWIGILAGASFFSGPKRFSWKNFAWLLPLIPFGIFLLIQKQTWGFYFYPPHSRDTLFEVSRYVTTLWDYLVFLFWEQGRWSVLCSWVAAAIFFVIHRKADKPYQSDLFLRLSFYACGGYLLFSSLTYMMVRYMLPVFPFVITITALAIRYLTIRNKIVGGAAFLLCMITPLFYLHGLKTEGDADMSYVRTLKAEQYAIDYMIKNDMLQQDKFSVNMPLVYATLDHRSGFLPDTVQPCSSRPVSEKTEFVVALTPGTSIENPQNIPLELIHEEYIYDVKMSVYRPVPDSLRNQE